MSILEQYGKLPSVEDMMAALASPVVPKSASRSEDMEMSTEEMIKEMFRMMSGHHTNVGVTSGQRARDSSYNSSTDTYDGLPATSQYNGNGV